MSRLYQLRISESVTKTVHVKDGITFKMELLAVLSAERMEQLLKDELANGGFEENEDGVFVHKLEGVDVEVNPKDGSVSLKVSIDSTLTESVEREVSVYDDIPHNEEEKAKNEIEASLKVTEAEIQEKVTAVLEESLSGIRSVLDKISTKVVVEGLKQKASELGEIEEISEDSESGDMTIRIRV